MSREPGRASGGPAYIGLVLERIRRQADLTPEALAHKTGTDVDYVSSVLSGESFPGRCFTHRYARACGADPQVLLKVWEDEHGRLDPRHDAAT